jgi:hypothetical protein
MGEFAPAAASIEAAFIGIAEAPDTPIRPSPTAPTVAKMIRMVLSSFAASIYLFGSDSLSAKLNLAKVSSSWIASFSQFLDSARKVAFIYGVRAAMANFGTARRVHTVFFGVLELLGTCGSQR